MVSPSPSPSYDNATSPPLRSPFDNVNPAPRRTSSSSSSSVPPLSSFKPQHYQHYRSNLPTPLPPDHRSPQKSRVGNQSQPKFKLLRKGKEKERGREPVDGGDDEAWVLEEGPISGPSSTNGPFTRRRSVDTTNQSTVESGLISESQAMEILASEEPEKKEKKSKGRGIVKKTSRLFSRDKDKSDKSGEHENSNGNLTATSGPVPGTRQLSYSSAHSSDSQVTTNGSTRSPNNLPSLTRPTSNQSRNRSPLESYSHSRRASQDSTTSWRGPARSARSGSSSLQQAPNDVGFPIPGRQGSHLGASVPGLSRHASPQPSSSQPPSTTARSPETFPSRMSTWFSHLLPTASSTTIQEVAIPSPPSTETSLNLPPSPLRKPPSAAASFLNAARQRAVDGVRHLLDSEAQPDKCGDIIWVMGVGHPGWRPSTPNASPGTPFLPDLSDIGVGEEQRNSASSSNEVSSPAKSDSGVLRPTAWSRKQREQTNHTGSTTTATSTPPNRGFSNLFTASTLSLALPASMSGGPPSKDPEVKGGMDSPGKTKKDRKEKEVVRWPDQFYDDFRSRIWCTYRSQYAAILSLPNNLLIPSPGAYHAAFGPPEDVSHQPMSPQHNKTPAPDSLSTRPSANTGWGWARPTEERGLTSDAGWGCMLRTGQSVLANALIHLHLGRDWRLPIDKPSTQPSNKAELADLENYAEYVRILSWFLDDPSPLCPFSVHRMALIGKELGKEVGEWFGPSTAAGALKTLTNSFSPCRLAVATATDSIIYRSDVYAASNLSSTGWEGNEPAPEQRRASASTTKSTSWGEKAVLVLVGIRLGLDGVNPIYFESVKALFTFPQSVGIAGGRPSSSYYFVGSQANSLFYLDPHFTRPAVPLETPPAPASISAAVRPMTPPPPPFSAKDDTAEDPVIVDPLETAGRGNPKPPYMLDVVDVDDISSQSESEEAESDISSSPSTRVRRARPSRTSKAAKRLGAKGITPPRSQSQSRPQAQPRYSPGPSPPSEPTQPDAFSPGQPSSSFSSTIPKPHNPLDPLPVDPNVLWYANAYPDTSLRTFHCEKVKKMPLAGLDPSMLLGFLVKNEADWEDFVERASKLPHKIFSVQDEPPSWDVDSDVGFESVSSEVDPEVDEPSLDDEEIEGVPIVSSRKPASFDTEGNGDEDAEIEEAATEIGHQDVVERSTTIVREGAHENYSGSVHATVGAVDITSQMGRVTLDDEAKDDESWTESGTPASQRPVLIDRAEIEPPSPSPIPVRQQANVNGAASLAQTSLTKSEADDKPDNLSNMEVQPDSSLNSTATSQLNTPASPTSPSQGEESRENPTWMKPKHPLMPVPLRTRTESWVDPGSGGREAPNGMSML